MASLPTGRRPTRRKTTLIVRAFALGAALALVTGAGLAAAGLYPNPAHNFGPVAGAGPLYNAASGANTRPLLVIRVLFNDVAKAGFTEAATSSRVFGPSFPNVAGYYSANSFGKMTFTRAPETCGTANDGIVSVDVGASNTWLNLGETGQDKADLDAVDALGCVDFSTFDRNNDGKLTADEVAFLEITALSRGCGASRAVASGGTYNGKTIPSNIGNRMSKSDSNTNIITLAHELGHQTLDAYDLYGYGVGSFDLFGPTCGPANTPSPPPDDTMVFEYNVWQKNHLGWITPTVVDKDGYYDVRRADTTGDAFILYDPARGTNDYFIVENREPTGGTYDQSATDSGLVIWRADDSKFGNGSLRAIEIMRPDQAINPVCVNQVCYGGSNGDAWDPSDFTTPQRSMTRSWRDGTGALVAVRAIGDAGSVMRAYFDVRGPGVLVDLYDLNKKGAVIITLGEAGLVSFPVMNTGEATDTFDFTVTGLPSGWTSSTDTQTLGAGVGSTANIKVTPPLNAVSTFYNLTATGTSQSDSSVTTSESFRVFALKRQTELVYTGALTGDYHDPAKLSATLTDKLSSNPLSGKTVVFDLGTQTQSGTTDGSGIATATIVVGQAPATVPLTATFFGDATYIPSIDNETFTITKEQTTTTYIGPTVILQGSSGVTLKAQLLEDGTTAPVPFGQTITLSLGAQSCTGTTDASGIASCTLTFNGALGPQPLKADFAGDGYYLPSADTGKTAIVFAFPSYGAFVLGDDTVAAATPSTVVTWWDSNWSAAIELSGGASPSAFKGFADTVVSLPTTSPAANCQGTWTSTGGNSAPPTSGVPSYMGVIVTSKVTKSGSTISGNFAEIVVVLTDPGYAPGPGHSGTGRIVATFCQ
jgi:M6 family metalloprotease-like protein